MSDPATAAGRRPPYLTLAVFLALAYGLSWWPWPLADLAARPDAALMIPIGPSIAALLVLAGTSGRRGVRALLRSAVHVRIGRWWFAIALPPVTAAVAAGLALAAGAGTPTAGHAVSVLATSLIALPILLVVGGPLGEELGWRGYVLPALLRHVTPITATLLLVPMWLAFHLPWIINRPERYGAAWALMLTGFALTMTWLHLRTGSVALAVVFHAAVNSSAAVAVQSFATADRPLVWNLLAALWLAIGGVLAAGPLRAAARPRPDTSPPAVPSVTVSAVVSTAEPSRRTS